MTTLNIDADLVAFRCAASVERSISVEEIANLPPETWTEDTQNRQEIALLRVDKLMRDLLANTEVDSYNAFLTGKDNFRKKVNPNYKANRKDKEPPRFLQQCRQFLVEEWKAVVSDKCEADDLLGINQAESTIIATLDKDLDTVAGQHFNWLKNTLYNVAPLDAIKHFYKQMLIGDRSDNIFGVDGIGPVKASKLIDVLDTEDEMIDVVARLYNDPKRFIMNAQCLWIMQNEGETWVNRVSTLPNLLQQEADLMSDFMTSLMADISMEVITTPQMMSGIQSSGIVPESMEPERVDLT